LEQETSSWVDAGHWLALEANNIVRRGLITLYPTQADRIVILESSAVQQGAGAADRWRGVTVWDSLVAHRITRDRKKFPEAGL